MFFSGVIFFILEDNVRVLFVFLNRFNRVSISVWELIIFVVGDFKMVFFVLMVGFFFLVVFKEIYLIGMCSLFL